MYVVLRVQCKRICGQQPLFLVYRGLVKWYDRGLQNLWWEFDSLIPCYDRKLESLVKSRFFSFLFYQRILIRNWTAGTVYVILIL